jgi:hypothetical protein
VSKEQPWSQDFFLKADEGTRTLDLLHGKPCRGRQRATTDGDARLPKPHGYWAALIAA